MRQTSTPKRTPAKPRSPKNRLETPLEQTTYPQENFYQKIQEKAYQIYLARGCAHGHDVDDWLKAEQSIKGA